MRIGLLTTYLALGEDTDSGIGQHFRILADALTDQGHQVHVIHPTLRPETTSVALAALSPRWTCDIVPVRTPLWLDRVLRRSWPCRVLLADFCAAFAANPAISKAVREHALEIIETHATSSPALIYLQRRNRPPVVTRISTTMSQMNHASNIHSRVKAWQAAIERYAVRKSDALLTHAGTHRDAICAIDGYKPDAFTIIPHGLPETSPYPHATLFGHPPEVLFVGRFEHRKGIDVLLEAIPVVLASFPQAHFTLAGSIGDGLVWEAFIRRHPSLSGSQVVAVGRVSDAELDRLYARCDIVVAPSRYESFGLIYVEAMRRAKPVVGCEVGGVPEVITDGVTGLLAQPGDVASLANCLMRLLGDAPLRQRLGEAGRQDFSRRFSASRMATASVEFYQRVASAHPQAPR